MNPPLHLVVAVAQDGCIGRAGALPWRLPEDMKHFKALTIGHAILMGRKTFESIGRPLPHRTSIVITSRPSDQFPPEVIAVKTLEEAIARARTIDDAPRVIGGGEVYEAAMPFATHLHVTHVDVTVPDGDTFFPKIDETVFRMVDKRSGETEGVTFIEYRRLPS